MDKDGTLHLAFRYIFESKARDLVHVSSADGGKTFSPPATITPDAWALEGCPHVGPDVAENRQELQFAWFTKGGIYRSASPEGGSTFSPRAVVSAGHRPSHPQLATLADGTTVIVWDEAFQENGEWATWVSPFFV